MQATVGGAACRWHTMGVEVLYTRAYWGACMAAYMTCKVFGILSTQFMHATACIISTLVPMLP